MFLAKLPRSVSLPAAIVEPRRMRTLFDTVQFPFPFTLWGDKTVSTLNSRRATSRFSVALRGVNVKNTVKMNQEECVRLIEMYRIYSFLWDTRDKAHHNRAKRDQAWKEISETLKQPVSTLKSRLRTLMGSYRSERSRENKSRTTGSGSDATYESKWFAYKHFDFLKSKDSPNPTSNSHGGEEFRSVPGEVIRDTTAVIKQSCTPHVTTSTAPSQDSTFRTPAIKECRKRKRPQDNADYDKMMGQTREIPIPQLSVNSWTDPYLVYALNLANELKKYDARTLAHVKRDIANVLFEADMGQMSSFPTTSFVSNIRSQEYMSPSEISSPCEYGSETSLGPPSPHGERTQDTQDLEESKPNFLLLPSDGNNFLPD